MRLRAVGVLGALAIGWMVAGCGGSCGPEEPEVAAPHPEEEADEGPAAGEEGEPEGEDASVPPHLDVDLIRGGREGGYASVELKGATAPEGAPVLVEHTQSRRALLTTLGEPFYIPAPPTFVATLRLAGPDGPEVVRKGFGTWDVPPEDLGREWSEGPWEVTLTQGDGGTWTARIRREDGAFFALKPQADGLGELILASPERLHLAVPRARDGHRGAAHDPERMGEAMEEAHSGRTDVGAGERPPGAEAPAGEKPAADAGAAPAEPVEAPRERVLHFEAEVPGDGPWDAWLTFDPGTGPVQARFKVEAQEE